MAQWSCTSVIVLSRCPESSWPYRGPGSPSWPERPNPWSTESTSCGVWCASSQRDEARSQLPSRKTWARWVGSSHTGFHRDAGEHCTSDIHDRSPHRDVYRVSSVQLTPIMCVVITPSGVSHERMEKIRTVCSFCTEVVINICVIVLNQQ